MNAEQARSAFAGIVDACFEMDELQEAFGYVCVDDGHVAGLLGSAIEERLLVLLGRPNVWPVSAHVLTWDDDTLFDMMEFIHDQDQAEYAAPAGIMISAPAGGITHDLHLSLHDPITDRL